MSRDDSLELPIPDDSIDPVPYLIAESMYKSKMSRFTELVSFFCMQHVGLLPFQELC